MSFGDWLLGNTETEQSSSGTTMNLPGNYADAAQLLTLADSLVNLDVKNEFLDYFANTVAPHETEMLRLQRESASAAVGSQTLQYESLQRQLPVIEKYNIKNLQSQMRLIGAREATTRKVLAAQRAQAGYKMEEIRRATPVMQKFYAEADIDVEELKARRAGQAVAGVEGAFKGAEAELKRKYGAMGIDPGSGSFQAAIRKVTMDKARAKAGLTTQAREKAEQESFQRKAQALAVSKGSTAQESQGAVEAMRPNQFINITAGSQQQSGGSQYDPLAAAYNFGNLARGGLANLGATTLGTVSNQQGTGTQSDPGGGILGTIAGIGAYSLGKKYAGGLI